MAVLVLSVIVPCYNQGAFLNEALESVYNQIYTDWECIIVNDGSTDDSEDIAQQWVAKDSRFKYFYKKNRGVSSARNFGISKASGKYIQFLDSDDILDKSKIHFSVDKLKEDKSNEIGIVISNFSMLSSDSKEIMPPFCKLEAEIFTLENFLFKWNVTFSVPIHCGFFKAELFEDIKFPENLSAQEDWVVWVSLFKTGCEAIFIDEPLAYYRINPNSRMSTLGIGNNKIKVLESFKSILTYDEYYDFTCNLISRLYKSNENTKIRLKEVRKSNAYQTGLMIKKILGKTKLLGIFRSFFKVILHFKAK